MGIVMNKYQTPLSDDFIMSLNEEVRDWLLESLNIQFIKNLVSPDREFAKDRPRDQNGRIIVDLCNPHILTDMDYFQPTANYYREHGVLTGLRPNSNRNSEYGKWLAEEVNRCWYGYVRPKDGEWVSGDMYFYLNYSPIIQNIMDEETGVFDRIMDFPKMWELIYLRSHYHYQARFGGIYNDFKKGQHAFEIAKRGASKSYYMASILAKLIMLGENRKAYKNTRGVIYATDKEKLVKDGTLNKFLDILDFCAENTQFPTQRVVDSLDKMTWEMGYKDLDTMSNKGTGNTTLGVVVGDKSGKGRGKRANRQIYEEIGEFPNLLDVYTTNRRSVEEGGHSFGQSIGVGTGGSKEADFSGCMEIIFNPAGYNIYGLPNVFDKSGGSKKCILFMGAYMNRAGCYNKDGVSDVSKALLEILEERRVIKYNSSRSSTLDQAIAEDPITIQEAILKKTTSGYPVAALAEQLQKIDTTAGYLDSIYVGDLVQDETGQPKLVTGPEYVPLRTFPHKDNRQPGAIEFHAFPVKGADGKVMSNRYIAGGDTFDDDSSDTLSLGSIYVLDLFTDEIVCEYTGREDFADQFYEKCRLICLYYNARLNYENNKKGLYTYFSKMHCIYLLTEVLDYLKSKEPAKDLHGNKSRGTQSTEPVKSYGRDRIKTWLCAPVPSPDSTDENPISRPRLYTLRSRALIQELIQWDPNGNYDRHDALLMLMLLREEMLRLSKGDVKGRFREKDPLDRSGDKFFSRYDKIVEARKKHQKHIL
jgi:hypothetical protein